MLPFVPARILIDGSLLRTTSPNSTFYLMVTKRDWNDVEIVLHLVEILLLHTDAGRKHAPYLDQSPDDSAPNAMRVMSAKPLI